MIKQSEQHATSDDILAYVQRKRTVGIGNGGARLSGGDEEVNIKAKVHSYTLHVRPGRAATGKSGGND